MFGELPKLFDRNFAVGFFLLGELMLFGTHFLFDHRKIVEHRGEHPRKKDQNEYAGNNSQRRKSRHILAHAHSKNLPIR